MRAGLLFLFLFPMATLTTKLDAVNTMLGYLNEAPVNSIADSTAIPPSAALAKGILDEVSREVQSEGWHYNTAQDFKLEADGNNQFVLPDNTMQVDSAGNANDVSQRGLNLFDRKEQTYIFDDDQLTVDITFLLEFEEIPAQDRRYITLKSSRMLVNRLGGSRELEALIYRDEMKAQPAESTYGSYY